LKSNTKGYGGKTHLTGSQDTYTTASSGRELYHLQFSLQAASPEIFGYTLRFVEDSLADHSITDEDIFSDDSFSQPHVFNSLQILSLLSNG
jgi:hypothetical protein